jgi:hypothetical protein
MKEWLVFVIKKATRLCVVKIEHQPQDGTHGDALHYTTGLWQFLRPSSWQQSSLFCLGAKLALSNFYVNDFYTYFH